MRLRLALISSVCCLPIATASSFAQSVGTTAAVNQSARGTPPSQAVRTISIGDNIIRDERIETDTVGLLQILLADGTAFTVGANASLVIDSFVYNPQAGTATVAASLGKGVFRFIGGRTSKTTDGVSLDTPVGTVGIRGAVVDINLDGRNGVPPHIDLIFGEEVTLTIDGTNVARIYHPGYSIVIENGQVRIVKTPPQWTSNIQLALAGTPGKSGGAPTAPTNAIVLASGLPQTNSNAQLPLDRVPTPTPRPEAVRSPFIYYANFDLVRTAAQEAVPATPTEPPVTQPTEPPVTQPTEPPVTEPTEPPVTQPTEPPVTEPTEPAEPPVTEPTEPTEPSGGGEEPPQTTRMIPLRVLTADTSSGGEGEGEGEWDGEGPVALAVVNSTNGMRGIVGGSETTDQTITLAVPQGSSAGTGRLVQGRLTLPVYSDTAFDSHSVEDAPSPFGPLSGIAYGGADGFTAYLLGVDGDPEQPVYALTGTPTGSTAPFEGDGVRRYSLTADPIQSAERSDHATIPFMSYDRLGGMFPDNADVSDLLIAQGDVAGGDARVLQTWLAIEGSGAEQESAIGVNVGALDRDGAGFALDRRGSFRAGGESNPYQLFGTAQTLAGPQGGAIFGADGQNFVVSSVPDANSERFFDASGRRDIQTERFSTIHVGNLVEETDNAARDPMGTYMGFAAGAVEGFIETSGGESYSLGPDLARSTDPEDVTVAFDPASRSLGGSIAIEGSETQARAEFGNGADDGPGGRSAYIDGDRFAATGASGNGTYFVSSGATSGTSDFTAPLCSDCSFLKWGWWGTQTPKPGTETQMFATHRSVHLGTWVAGDVSTLDDLSSLAETSAQATYSGSAVGNVVSGGATYVATGTLGLTYDFGSRDGRLDVSDFDGRSFGGTVVETSDGSGLATFGGPVSGEGLLQGSATGAFVNDGLKKAAGVIGNFGVETSDGGWSAAGIFGGARGQTVDAARVGR